MVLAALEAGGTKFRAAIFSDETTIVDQQWIPTTTPEETLGAVEAFFAGHKGITALGVASFGPLVIDRASPKFGSISTTPKPGWTDAPLLSRLAENLGVPADIQTDVEAAAVAEWRHGEGQGHSRVGYVTVGTGIGAAYAVDGVPIRGRAHTEMGHVPVRRNPNDSFPGICPFHTDCLEGMAAGPAIAERWQTDPKTLDDRAEVWELEAYYLAQLIRVYTYTFAPDIVLFGGGVGTKPLLDDLIREAVHTDLGGYFVDHETVVKTAGLGEDAGLIGAATVAAGLVS